ncbi:RNA helicase [Paramarasmius palmivorus]|uniref:RNA helicase n=1 Tax=Paramarasmius palmivorus TaxID=297713 RepID=A0AAW0C8I0_9AGAR
MLRAPTLASSTRFTSSIRLSSSSKTWVSKILPPSLPSTSRFRTGGQPNSKSFAKKQPFRQPPVPKVPPLPQPPSPTLPSVSGFLHSYIPTWVKSATTYKRLLRFGLPKDEIQSLLHSFRHAVKAGHFATPEAFNHYALIRYSTVTKTDVHHEYYDMVTTSLLYAWASHESPKSISPETLKSISLLHTSTSISYPADRFPDARRMRRHFIMHVGPTNSGKTHNALRALAASDSGVYAGPLRLLAHEIWERLNTGKIVPLDVDPDLTPATTTSAIKITSSSGNPDYIRQCNLLTGETQKTTSETASLLSCTVEMVPSTRFSVAVIDEIQMIGDLTRGYAWTNAVLSICAPEVHLCGEETAIPVIQNLLKDTNDTLEIRRYERLSPLTVSEDSLKGDLGNVQKGDCVVAFTRRDIFKFKKIIEKKTGMKCATVYGKLPPETRARQAELFNDPDSGYDVLIGSDAIGMGLNLKINRIVFSDIAKYDGRTLRALTVSQVKQIAGRAGRFSASSQNNSGSVTTLHPEHLPSLARTLARTLPPIPYAVLSPNGYSLDAASRALPPSAGLELCWEAHQYIGILGSASEEGGLYRYSHIGYAPGGKTIPSVIDEMCLSPGASSQIMFSDRLLLALAPLPWKDNRAHPYIAHLIQAFGSAYYVPLMPLIRTKGNELLGALEAKPGPELLDSLELFHKLLTSYSWLAYRQPIAFSDSEEAFELTEKVEGALTKCLSAMTVGEDHEKPSGQEGPNIEYYNRREQLRLKAAREKLKEHGRTY